MLKQLTTETEYKIIKALVGSSIIEPGHLFSCVYDLIWDFIVHVLYLCVCCLRNIKQGFIALIYPT